MTAPCNPSSIRTRGTFALIAKADIHGPALLQLLRHATGDHLGRIELRNAEGVERAEQFAGNRRIMGGGGGLQLVGRLDDDVDEDARHADVVGFERSVLGDALDLRNHEAAGGARGERHFHGTQRGTFMFEGKVAVLIRSGRADDRDIRVDRTEVKPAFSVEFNFLYNRFRPCLQVHCTTVPVRVDEGVHAHLGQHARALRRALAEHVEHDAGRHVPGGQLLAHDHLPDQRRFGIGRPRRIGSADDPGQKPGTRDMVNALGAEHVARGNRMDGCQIPRKSCLVKAFPQSLENRVGAAEAG